MSELLLLLLVASFQNGWSTHTSLCPGWNNLSCDCEYDCDSDCTCDCGYDRDQYCK